MAAAAGTEPARSLLPTEVYGSVARHLATADLFTLTLVSRMMNGVATPPLYQDIVLRSSTSGERVLSLLDTLIQRVDIAALVQRFVLAWTGPFEQISHIGDQLRLSLPGLVNIQHLTVSQALSGKSSIFGDVTLPALRHFHAFSAGGIPISFFDRHPDLLSVTARLTDGADGPKSWGYSAEEICIYGGGTTDIMRLLSDGHPRPALRRLAFTKHTTAAELSALKTQCPNVTQISYIPGSMRYNIDVQWPGICRLGLVVHPHYVQGSGDVLAENATWARSVFPDLHTLDILLMKARDSLSEEELSVVDEAVRLVHAVEGIQMVTAACRAYIRVPDSTSFSYVPLKESHGAPVMPWDLFKS